jgi:hypothetical protein
MNLRPRISSIEKRPSMRPPITELRTASLHEAYHTADYETCLQMANLGATCYTALKEDLFSHWNSVEDTEKAELWREEGRQEGKQTVLETVKTRLAAAEDLAIRLATETAGREADRARSEQELTQLRNNIEKEATRRVYQLLEMRTKEFELAKANEVSSFQQRLAAAEAKEEMVALIKEAQIAMREKVVWLEEENATLLKQLQPKSSHAIGKEGEATVFELFEKSVLPHFLYAKMEDMSAVGHSADFHVWVQSPTGKTVKILIDAKKYKGAVRTKEVEKLHADVDADEEAVAGLMVSLDSAISATKQFQLEKTPKMKLVMYLTLKDMLEEMRGPVLCWATRVVSTVVSDTNSSDKQHMLDSLSLFLKELNKTVADTDATIKAAAKVVELAKATRSGLLARLEEFRVGTLQEAPAEAIEKQPTEKQSKKRVHARREKEGEQEGEQCIGKKRNGERCLNRARTEEKLCKKHSVSV